MKIIYINSGCGVSGAALLGALVDLGANGKALVEEVNKTLNTQFDFKFYKTFRNDVTATGIDLKPSGGERVLTIKQWIDAGLRINPEESETARGLTKILKKYSSALARLQNIPEEQTLLREPVFLRVAAISTAYFAALKQLGISSAKASHIPLNTEMAGREKSSYLVTEMARGSAVKHSATGAVNNTPLGVALLTASVVEYGPVPEMFFEGTGYGLPASGSGEVLQVLSGYAPNSTISNCARDVVKVVETNIDDMNPEFFPYIIEKLLKLGALDAFLTPIYMKKGRPANILTALCREEKLEQVLTILFRETTTLGIRIREESRRCLRRQFLKVTTPYGEVSVKAGYIGEGCPPVQLAPEFEDCKLLAQRQNVPIKEVYASAQREAYKKTNQPDP